MKDKNILLCVTGGIAAFKAVLLLRLLTKAGARVRVVMTPSATRFVGALTFEALSQNPVVTDLWQTGGSGGESHILLSEWADLILIAPATANTLARLAVGLADDVVAATVLAAVSPVVVAPAMHTRMWNHPATVANLATLREQGVRIIEPVSGELASGLGVGRLAEPEIIFEAAYTALAPKDLFGCHVVVSAGPTVESIDPVRFISNHSSGKMGYALARAAVRRGARVTLVSGPTALAAPPDVELVRVNTAGEMHAAVFAASGDADAIVMSAAVADFTPRNAALEKIKKSNASLILELEPTVDILAELGARRAGERAARPILVGFAMESTDLERHAADKLRRKGCDLIVANNIREPGAGFGHDTNIVTLFERDGSVNRLPLLSKDEVADRILDRVAALRAAGPGAVERS